ncbi:Bromodomain containing protein [Tritrichomonas foetus]|uniref:Bromodomain containing protein n=1 Tax=Tritrichomonas foetus TaxID=1144522 RepID=A0A1J4K7U0_9EUKA|nr:Bromodomain containing protein [Tritrichomonas foetus]|eukprot:OHT05780.1 Bromodomain containing protein [Tritrichomonas foetus]
MYVKHFFNSAEMKATLKQQCLKIMDELMTNRIAELFVDPIDPELDNCPDYYEVIKTPMDLTKVRENLESDKYDTVQQWKSDMELIWSNAILYNGNEALIGIIATELSYLFAQYTQGFTDTPFDDWLTQLGLLCDEFVSAIKAVSLVSPYLTKKSPSIMALTPNPSEPEDVQMTNEEIAQIGNDIKKLKNPKHILQIFDCLKSMEPQLVGDKTSLKVNICELSTSTLLALRDELDLIKRRAKLDD